MIEKAIPASELWTSRSKNHPTRYYIYTGGLIHQKTSATSSFQWAEAPQRSCTPSWEGCRSRLTICQLNQFNTNSECNAVYYYTIKFSIKRDWMQMLFFFGTENGEGQINRTMAMVYGKKFNDKNNLCGIIGEQWSPGPPLILLPLLLLMLLKLKNWQLLNTLMIWWYYDHSAIQNQRSSIKKFLLTWPNLHAQLPESETA